MTYIAHRLRGLDFDTLAAECEAAGADGMEFARAERAARDSSKCAPCGRRRAEARLRVWLMEHTEAGK